MVYLQVTQTPTPEAEAAMPPEVQGSRLKKTLTNAGLYPQPEAEGKKKRLLHTQSTGRMAIFTQGEGAALSKGAGDPM